MAYQPFLIAPFKSGLITYYKPFLIGNDAFSELENCYEFRGRIQKREGCTSLGRIPQWRTANAITNASPPVVTTTANHNLATGDMVWLENCTGATALNNTAYRITVTGATTFSLQNLNTGANIPASGLGTAGDIYLPVVGLRTYLQPGTSNEFLIVFHPKKCFLYNTSTTPSTLDDITFIPDTTAFSWTGTKDNFFYTSNYANAMWTTNNIDHIRYFNGSSTAGWTTLQPAVNAGGTTLDNCSIILPYRGRLIALNTSEGGTSFSGRARWSQIGTPYTVTDATHAPPTGFGVDVNAWREDIVGKGGYIDADTSENIVSAEIVNDTLIVGFQYSTWRLRYTGNEILPFLWERINVTFGSEAPFSTVVVENEVLMISRRGIIKANFNNVQRIDIDIIDQVEDIETGTIIQGFSRIFGIRDYDKQLIYWTYGSQIAHSQTPDRILCYNYLEGTWATFGLSFSCLGKYRFNQDNTWATWTSVWQGDTSTWNTPVDGDNIQMIVGGRVDSYIYRILDDSVSQDNGTNYNFSISTKRFNPYLDMAKRCKLGYLDLYITSNPDNHLTITSVSQAQPAVVTTSVAHGLSNNSTVTIIGCSGMTALNNIQFMVTVVNATSFSLQGVDSTGYPTYTANSGQAVLNSEISLLHYIDDNDDNPVVIKKVSTSVDGQSAKYVRVFLGATAHFHQIVLQLSNGLTPFLKYPPAQYVDNELNDAIKGKSPFELQGIVLHTRPEGRIKG